MPRHPLGTGNVLPVPPLDLEEVKFWLRIMEEHALFIKTGLPFDKTDLIEEACAFEREFKELRVRAEKLSSEKKFAALIVDTIGSLKEFLRYKRLLLGLSLTNKLGSALPPLFFDHLIREAEYFMAILEKIDAGKKLAVVKALEADFWLRIMAEHTKFIGSRIDPSERSLMEVVRGYQVEFDDLSMQGRDYVSFLEHKPMELPAFDRFLQDSRSATLRLRDFKQAAYDMIIKNRMLSTIPAAMADHVRREADHFLLVLAMMEKGVIKVEKDLVAFKHKHQTKFGLAVGDEFCDNFDMLGAIEEIGPEREPKAESAIDDIELDYTPGTERETITSGDTANVMANAKWVVAEVSNEESVVAEASDEEPIIVEVSNEKPIIIESNVEPDANDEVAVKAKVVAAEKTVSPPKTAVAPKGKKQGKYKWGGDWPRQLGKLLE